MCSSVAPSGSQFDPRVVEAFLASLDEILEIRLRYSAGERNRQQRRQ
jgi:response regulator RpfG family c-di-GMP phosphodiesterase